MSRPTLLAAHHFPNGSGIGRPPKRTPASRREDIILGFESWLREQESCIRQQIDSTENEPYCGSDRWFNANDYTVEVRR